MQRSAERGTLAIVAAYVGMCLIWGTTWLAIKVGLHSLGPLTGVGFRFIIAGSFLYAVAAATGSLRRASEVPWKLVIVYATLLFGLNYVLTYTSETHLSSGLVSVLFGTLPFFTFVFAHFLIGEKGNARTWSGAAIAFCGLAVISLGGDVRGSPLYALATVVGAAGSAFATVYAKRHAYRAGPLVTLPPAMLLSGIVVSIVGLALERTDWHAAAAPASLGALFYLAIFGSGVAFFLMMWLVPRVPAWAIGMGSLIYPVIAVTVGIIFGGEAFGIREVLGSLLVLAGMGIALTASR